MCLGKWGNGERYSGRGKAGTGPYSRVGRTRICEELGILVKKKQYVPSLQVFPRFFLITKEKTATLQCKNLTQYLIQMIKVNITKNKMYQYYAAQ